MRNRPLILLHQRALCAMLRAPAQLYAPPSGRFAGWAVQVNGVLLMVSPRTMQALDAARLVRAHNAQTMRLTLRGRIAATWLRRSEGAKRAR